MSAKHTPGPWYATNTQDDGDTLSRDCNEEYSTLATWTVSTDPKVSGWHHDGGYGGYGVTEANARLMAAAPELLEALKALTDHDGKEPIGATLWEKAYSAIAKVEGEP